jgi:hypothetical protein
MLIRPPEQMVPSGAFLMCRRSLFPANVMYLSFGSDLILTLLLLLAGSLVAACGQQSGGSEDCGVAGWLVGSEERSEAAPSISNGTVRTRESQRDASGGPLRA